MRCWFSSHAANFFSVSGPPSSLTMYVDPKKVMGIEGMPEIDAQALLHELLSASGAMSLCTRTQCALVTLFLDNARLMHRRDAFNAS